MNLEELANELGISKLPAGQQQAMLQKIYQTLQTRVGVRLAENLSDEELQKLEQLSQHSDEATAAELKKLFPNYEEIVRDEIKALKQDIQSLLPKRA